MSQFLVYFLCCTEWERMSWSKSWLVTDGKFSNSYIKIFLNHLKNAYSVLICDFSKFLGIFSKKFPEILAVLCLVTNQYFDQPMRSHRSEFRGRTLPVRPDPEKSHPPGFMAWISPAPANLTPGRIDMFLKIIFPQ